MLLSVAEFISNEHYWLWVGSKIISVLVGAEEYEIECSALVALYSELLASPMTFIWGGGILPWEVEEAYLFSTPFTKPVHEVCSLV